MSSAIPFREIEVPVYKKYKAVCFLASNVKNCQEIKENLIKANKDYDYGFLNAKNVVSLEQLYSGFYKTVMSQHDGNMKSRTLHTELIYSLSPFKNIMDCLNKFGISKDSNSILIVKIVESETLNNYFIKTQQENLKSIIDGEFLEITDDSLQEITDIKALEKNYKLKIRSTKLENNWPSISRNLVSITHLKGL
ncbi:Cgi121 protein [Pichia kluyveri]|uniref:EKC/KEOPS complex subunit CGI121 n=1 Tax=Pichia kluyveri TaxID=36015 RepID=A0AAV5RCQ5_PICKL|nr:Cgi121 protein [Pichia kluyveri]